MSTTQTVCFVGTFMGMSACAAPLISPLKNQTATNSDFSHVVSLTTLAMGNRNGGKSRALKAARNFCEIKSASPEYDVNMSDGGGLYEFRMFAFACPESEKDTQ